MKVFELILQETCCYHSLVYAFFDARFVMRFTFGIHPLGSTGGAVNIVLHVVVDNDQQ